MKKKELIRDLASRKGYTIRESEEMVSSVFEELFDIFSEGHSLNITGFGKFEVVMKAESTARNPRTGEYVVVPEHGVLKFKPSSALKEAVK